MEWDEEWNEIWAKMDESILKALNLPEESIPQMAKSTNSSLTWTDERGHIHITEGIADPRGVF